MLVSVLDAGLPWPRLLGASPEQERERRLCRGHAYQKGVELCLARGDRRLDLERWPWPRGHGLPPSGPWRARRTAPQPLDLRSFSHQTVMHV